MSKTPSTPRRAICRTSWLTTDEWYGFHANPRDSVHVLLTLDETSYEPGDGAMGTNHPVAWCHEHEGGRAFYTALGHTKESYRDPRGTSRRHRLGAGAGSRRWALGKRQLAGETCPGALDFWE